MNNQEDSLITVLQSLYAREFQKLKKEIIAYKEEKNIWIIDENIKNSGGNLCLHLIGNLNTYICDEFGKTGYIRKREQEFSLKNVPRNELVAMIEQTEKDLAFSLNQITVKTLKAEYPHLVLKEKTTSEYFLVHLLGHLTYHLGQINYHRRLLDQ